MILLRCWCLVGSSGAAGVVSPAENVPPANVVMDLSNVQIQPFLDGINQSNGNS